MNIQNRTRHFGIKYKKIIELPTIETQGKLIKILDKTNSIFFIQEKGTNGADKVEFGIEQLEHARLVEEISLKGKHA